MWIFIKLVGMIVAYFVRLSSVRWDRFSGGESEIIDGIPFKVVKIKNKQNVLSTSFVFEFKTKTIFKLSPESRIDKFFKSIDFSEEIQTGDNQFDDLIYIACDHIQFRQKIVSDSRLRDLIKIFFNRAGRSIKTNGTTLVFNIKGDISADPQLKQLALQIQKIFTELNQKPPHEMMDPFVIKAMVAEACVWSFGIYALLSFLDILLVNNQDVHFNKWLIIKSGLVLGLTLVALALLLVYLFFRGSSRGHRIFVESFIVLLLTVPMGGIGFVYDLNTGLDRSPAVQVQLRINNLERKVHRSRKGGTSYSYHMSIQQISDLDRWKVPTDIRIEQSVFYELQNRQNALITVRQGWLKYPWIQHIQPN